ncbi:MAG: sulfite exporter TauE/SafE family protein [Verrucomicrobia bacterium]|nr:sulfite exporter TauE/SafE family protein [Verrucomicrobiota bacterium]
MDAWILPLGILLVAFLYSSVGHAGASGYIAVMALCSIPAQEIRPVTLSLNIVVAVLGGWNFIRAGHFSMKLLWPLAIASIPLAFLGGYLRLPNHLLHLLLGLVLWGSALRFLIRPKEETVFHAPKRSSLLATGGILGLLAGLTGTGGGIFLTPWMIWKKWAPTKTVAAVSVIFILVNSISGLAGYISSVRALPRVGWIIFSVAIVGGWFGSHWGSRRYSPVWIQRLLALVLLIAGTKMIFIP